MSDKIINLNRARKQRRRAERRKEADENAVRFGRSKAERRLEDARAERARDRLDQHRRDE